jgi:hypothetical protein
MKDSITFDIHTAIKTSHQGKVLSGHDGTFTPLTGTR